METTENTEGTENDDGACATCVGIGLVDGGTCPDCDGSGDAMHGSLAFERFVNGNVGKRLEDGGIEVFVLGVMWDSKMIAFAQNLAQDHGACDELLDFDDSELCTRHECGGCREGDAPCESYKLWLAGMLMARAFRAESILSNRAAAAPSAVKDSSEGHGA